MFDLGFLIKLIHQACDTSEVNQLVACVTLLEARLCDYLLYEVTGRTDTFPIHVFVRIDSTEQSVGGGLFIPYVY